MGDSNPFENVCEIMRLAGVHRTVPLDNFTLMRLKTLDSLLYGYCSSAGLAMPHAEGDSTKVEDANSLYFTRLAVKVGEPIDTSENWLWAMDRLAQAIRCRLTGSDIQRQIAEGFQAAQAGLAGRDITDAIIEAGNAAQGDDEAKTRRRRGRKKADHATIQREAEIAANWTRAREGGAYKPEWAKDNGMTEPELDAILDRVYKRKKRSDK